MNRKPSFSKLLCWVLTIAMLGMILPQLSLPVFADDSGACGDSLYWSFSESTGALTITGSGQMWEPESMGDMPPWYSYRDQITSVSLPYGLSNICGFAFKNCGKLTSVTIPDSVTKISLEAFSNCTGLKSVTIPKNVQLIEETAFVDCTDLAGVWILNPSCKIEVSYTVMYHADMELVYFYDTFGPDSRIYGYRNSTAEQYTKANYTEDFHHDFIPIDGGYGQCGDALYWGFDNVTGTLTVAGSGDMWDFSQYDDPAPWAGFADQIKTVSLLEGLTGVGKNAFSNCGNLSSVTIPESALLISTEAFSNCTSLKSVTIPKNVQKIDELAFYNCTNLADAWILNPSCKIEVSYTVMIHADMELVYFYDTFGPDARIHGYRDSTAEAYTKANYPDGFHHEFIPIEGKPKKFADVPKDAYYADAVDWAVEKEITKGTSDTAFSPDQSCTRAQVVTFLHRAAGTEAPSGGSNPFTDLIDGSYYFDAVLWAVEKGVTTGTSPTTFSPEMSCTRAQVVTFLWRAAGEPAPDSFVLPFLDVPKDAYYRTAVVWALENGITTGTSTTTFSPDAICSRAQIVTFLYRDLA